MSEAPQTRAVPDKASVPATRKWLSWTLVIVWLCLIGWFSLNSDPPGLDWLIALSAKFRSPKLALRILQGLIHLSMYAVAAVLVAWALRVTRPPVAPLALFAFAVVFLTGIGLVLEYLQRNIPRRAFDLLDLSSNLVGVVLALGIFWVLHVGPFRRRAAELGGDAGPRFQETGGKEKWTGSEEPRGGDLP